MTRIGPLRARFDVQAASLPAGADATVWTTVATLWGSITAEAIDHALTVSGAPRVTHAITLRRSPSVAVTSGMRLVRGGRTFAILAVRDADDRKRFIEVRAEEGGTLG